ncbi:MULTISPECIES: DUF397 domain-containing protein [Micromonospora]|uniref:DUF397 domain-containing protein n=1 Tax=Micromonospora haikouensis TaxID=686309 RepID=A0A0D0WPX7_9ACTN|nr:MULTISPECIES: DUF397 domain-containing protein [Micromonospora]KIR60859.1 hypothetical protein TK50_23815 [Micromonospora haikouensis]
MRALDDQWRTSTRSGGNGACVEARYTDHSAQVRDSKDRQGPVLSFSPSAWTSFVDALKR